jgi:hypothetical protein
VLHADVNAAFNIAAVSCAADKMEANQSWTSHKRMRKRIRDEMIIPGAAQLQDPEITCRHELFAQWDPVQMIPGDAERPQAGMT